MDDSLMTERVERFTTQYRTGIIVSLCCLDVAVWVITIRGIRTLLGVA